MPPSDLIGSAREPPVWLAWLSTVTENIGAGAPAPVVVTPTVRTPAGCAGTLPAHAGGAEQERDDAGTRQTSPPWHDVHR